MSITVYSMYALDIVEIPPVLPPIKGTLYLVGDPPKDTSTFWIQQYPTYFGERGRIVVEFWGDNLIQGVVSFEFNK